MRALKQWPVIILLLFFVWMPIDFILLMRCSRRKFCRRCCRFGQAVRVRLLGCGWASGCGNGARGEGGGRQMTEPERRRTGCRGGEQRRVAFTFIYNLCAFVCRPITSYWKCPTTNRCIASRVCAAYVVRYRLPSPTGSVPIVHAHFSRIPTSAPTRPLSHLHPPVHAHDSLTPPPPPFHDVSQLLTPCVSRPCRLHI